MRLLLVAGFVGEQPAYWIEPLQSILNHYPLFDERRAPRRHHRLRGQPHCAHAHARPVGAQRRRFPQRVYGVADLYSGPPGDDVRPVSPHLRLRNLRPGSACRPHDLCPPFQPIRLSHRRSRQAAPHRAGSDARLEPTHRLGDADLPPLYRRTGRGRFRSPHEGVFLFQMERHQRGAAGGRRPLAPHRHKTSTR